jgi:hypothetical protein
MREFLIYCIVMGILLNGAYYLCTNYPQNKDAKSLLALQIEEAQLSIELLKLQIKQGQ